MRHLLWVYSFAVAFGFFGTVAVAQEEVGVDPAPPVSGGAELRGRVVTASGAALAGATVTLEPISADPTSDGGAEGLPGGPMRGPVSPGGVDEDGVVRRSFFLFETRTGPDGAFGMRLPFGEYVIRVAAPGFQPVFYDGVKTRSEAQVVTLDGSRATAVLEVILEPLNSVSGRVTDEKTGAPVRSGRVVAQPAQRGGVPRQAEIGADGRYVVEGLIPGTYQIEVLAPGYLTGLYEGGTRNGLVEVENGELVQGVDVALSSGLAISGRVMDGRGEPLAGAVILAWPAVEGGRSQEATTGADGAYRMTGLTLGSYVIAAGKPGYRRVFYRGVANRNEATLVRVSVEDQPEDIHFELAPSGAVFGRVAARADGVPVNSALVVVQALAGGQRRAAYTGEDGAYVVSDLPTADYLVWVQADGFVPVFFDGASTRENARAVRVLSGSHTTDVDVLLDRPGSLAGRVTDGEGNGVAGAVVQLSVRLEELSDRPGGGDGREPPGAGRFVAVRRVETDAEGRYVVSEVLPGRYRMQVFARGFAPREFSGEEGEEPADIRVEVGADRTGIDVVLQPLGAILGRVSGLGREAAPQQVEVVAVALPEGAQASRRFAENARVFRGEVVDAEEGAYQILGLPAGRYLVRASARGYMVSWYDRADSVDAARPVEVALAERASGVDFVLSRGGLVSGTVVADESGAGIPGAVVSLRPIGGAGGWRVQSGRSGGFEFGGLPNGRFLLRAEARDFVGEFYRDTDKPEQAVPIVIGEEKMVSDLLLGLARRAPADFDANGQVNFADLILFLQRMMGKASQHTGVEFDLNGDGAVDFRDFLALIEWMKGAGKVTVGAGALAWEVLEGQPDEVLAGLLAEAFPAAEGYVLRLRYDPDQAEFLGAEGRVDGHFGDGRFVVYEPEPGVLVLAGGRTDGAARAGDGPLARLRFRPVGEAVGVTLATETGVALAEEGHFAMLKLPEPQYLELPPRAFRLLQNVPNPFNPITSIAFELPDEAQVELTVYNLVGQPVRKLVREVRPAGRYRVTWDGKDDLGRDVSSGVYFYHFKAGEFAATRRMLLLR